MSAARARGGTLRRLLLAAIGTFGLGACEATGPGLQPVVSGLLGETWRARLAVGDELGLRGRPRSRSSAGSRSAVSG